jgi:hypothetical protein
LDDVLQNVDDHIAHWLVQEVNADPLRLVNGSNRDHKSLEQISESEHNQENAKDDPEV